MLIFPSGQPKAQPKPATEAKAGRRNRRAARRGKAANRPKPKTSEELDAEMDDYFVTENGAPAEPNAPVNGQAQQQPATNGGGEDLGMGDISVSLQERVAMWLDDRKLMICIVIDSFTDTIFKIPILWIFTGRDLGLIRFLFSFFFFFY